ncbi:MAG: hypothetical protein COB83_02975 [Gammaproteobacteria bacterium]|nr:MAG: hypothetical protein COB83_02975 [Gammaproteobacteria bacterium]
MLKNTTTTTLKRNIILDLMRTLAIVLMVIFHFIYDLRYFGWISWDIPDGDGWRHFRYVILSLFFLCIGASLVYSHQQKFHLKAFTRRLIKIAIGASITTVMSLVMFTNNWIYFGVLQFILIASLLAAAFIYRPKIALLIGLVIVTLAQLNILSRRWPFEYINELLPNYTTDYVPFFPWFAVILFGITLAHCAWFNREWLIVKKLEQWQITQQLALPGKHSLIIYLVHQPLLFALLAPIHWLMN